MNPSWGADDLSAPDATQKLLSRFLIDVRMNNGPWQPIPHFSLDPDLSKPLPDWANSAYADMTHLRILFPVPEAQAGGTIPAEDDK